ncbi:hypothetical protein [Gramella sp. AN32]|uniref:Glycine dehydrogenase n=1 Tax=Christiangramia antarctica TaxID=2058158 RepID=A0ABW5X4I8_9FLAO|nr:hypothetical protein [Gramella sp. AN32]MCM4157488.1 hypothetical protein [Gramella sp. AN32]
MGVKKKNFLIDCSEAGICCDKAQYKDASFSEKAKLLIHLIYCKICRKRTFRNSKLTKLIKESKLQSCPEDQKKVWKEQIQTKNTTENP